MIRYLRGFIRYEGLPENDRQLKDLAICFAHKHGQKLLEEEDFVREPWISKVQHLIQQKTEKTMQRETWLSLWPVQVRSSSQSTTYVSCSNLVYL